MRWIFRETWNSTCSPIKYETCHHTCLNRKGQAVVVVRVAAAGSQRARPSPSRWMRRPASRRLLRQWPHSRVSHQGVSSRLAGPLSRRQCRPRRRARLRRDRRTSGRLWDRLRGAPNRGQSSGWSDLLLKGTPPPCRSPRDNRVSHSSRHSLPNLFSFSLFNFTYECR